MGLNRANLCVNRAALGYSYKKRALIVFCEIINSSEKDFQACFLGLTMVTDHCEISSFY